jgi:hypothetical protein
LKEQPKSDNSNKQNKNKLNKNTQNENRTDKKQAEKPLEVKPNKILTFNEKIHKMREYLNTKSGENAEK